MADVQVPAGWYPDPTGDTSKIRYWNGTAWTEEFMDAAVSAGRAGATGVQSVISAGGVVESAGTAGTTGVPTAGATSAVPTTTAASTTQFGGYPGATMPGAGTPTSAQPYGYQQPGYTPVATPRKGKGMAIASLVLAIVSFAGIVVPYLAFIPALLAVIFGIIGIKQGALRALAIVGLVLGALGLIANIAFALFLFALISAHPELLYNQDPAYIERILREFLGGFAYLR